jgi:chemotaxis protein methyltransferase CheR
VLIYFDVEAKRRTIAALVRVLRPGGVLIVGRSESLFNVPEAPPLVSLGGTLVYRKALS